MDVEPRQMELADLVKHLGRVRRKDVIGLGKVKFYDNNVDKQFGFLESEHGDIFFHGSRAMEFVSTGGDEPGADRADMNPDGSLSDPPRKGNEVIFIAETGPRGLRAIKWVKWDADEYLAILDEIESRPMYRLIHRKGHRLQSPLHRGANDGFKTEWEGRNLAELRDQFPKESYAVFDNEDNAWYFETLNNDAWEACDDPR